MELIYLTEILLQNIVDFKLAIDFRDVGDFLTSATKSWWEFSEVGDRFSILVTSLDWEAKFKFFVVYPDTLSITQTELLVRYSI